MAAAIALGKSCIITQLNREEMMKILADCANIWTPLTDPPLVWAPDGIGNLDGALIHPTAVAGVQNGVPIPVWVENCSQYINDPPHDVIPPVVGDYSVDGGGDIAWRFNSPSGAHAAAFNAKSAELKDKIQAVQNSRPGTRWWALLMWTRGRDVVTP